MIPTASEYFRYVSIDATTMRASTVTEIDADERDAYPRVDDDALVENTIENIDE